jgi:curved DNA-binding protein CbpA
MAIVARGTVQDRPWGRTLCFVADRRFSGELVVDSENRRFVVSFDEGAVVAAISPLATDAAVRVALTAGLVMSSQVAEIGRQVAARADLDEVDAVALALRLAPDQVDRLRRRVIAHKAIRGFALERGEFILTDERHLPFSPNHAIDVRALIYLGARTHMTEQRLLQELARLGPGFQLKADAIPTLAQYGFSEAEKPILAALRAAPIATLDLDAAAPELDPRTARAVVYALAVTNALDVSTTSVGVDRPHQGTKTPTSQTERLRKTPTGVRGTEKRPGMSGTMPGVAGGAGTKTPTPVPPPPSDRGDATLRAKRSSTDPPSQPNLRSRSASSDPPFEVRSPRPSEPSPTRRAGSDDGRGRVPTTATPPAGVARAKAPKSSIPMPDADDPSRRRKSSTPPPASRGRASQPAIDSKDHRRPTRRSSLNQVNLPIAAEVRALIRDRARQMDSGADHFTLLGVHTDSLGEDIRKGYFALARQLHPDRLTALGISDEDRTAQRLFAHINAAFAVLSSPTKRQDYRKTLAAGGERAVRDEQDQAEALARKLMAAEEKYQIGLMALRRDQFDVALEHFKEAVALNPDEADHHAAIGWTIFAAAPDKTVVFKEVRGILEKAIRIAPKAVTPRIYLGRVARMMNRDKEAIEQFEEVLRIYPGHSEAKSELRILELRQPGGQGGPDKGGGLFGRFKK